jgi:hypothetical protein
MAQTHFERLVEVRIEQIKEDLLHADAGDIAKIARLQGRYAEILEAVKMFRQAMQTDIDPDGGL